MCRCCGRSPVAVEFSGNLSLTLPRWVRPQECVSCFDGFAIGRSAWKISKSAALLSMGHSQAEFHQVLLVPCCSPVPSEVAGWDRVPGEVAGWEHLPVTGFFPPGALVSLCVGKGAPREEFLPAVLDMSSDLCRA